MRTLSKSRLRRFWELGYHDAERPLVEWYHMMDKAEWHTPHELKADIATASILRGGRVVFNIAGNKYRVIVDIDYRRQQAFVRFVGTHAQYDQVDAETI